MKRFVTSDEWFSKFFEIILMLQDNSKRAAKELFVTGHAGASLWENEEVILVAVASYAAWRSVTVHLPGPSASLARHLLTEFLFIIIPMLLSITYTAYSPVVLFFLLSVFILGLVKPAPQYKSSRVYVGLDNYKPFSIAFRASLMLLTIGAILAVDFPVFPRKFAKTESYGTSLMDLGVGAFMFSNGLVAGPRLKAMSSWKEGVLNIAKSFRISVPVLLLGAVRLALTKGINYQEHVTEYGVHWNFFITLGIIPVFTALLQLLVPRANFAFIGGVIMILYEECLRRGLERYIMTAPRSGGFFQLNREGISSFFGYWAIFLIAAYMGQSILSDPLPLQPIQSADKEPKKKESADDDWSDRAVIQLKNLIELISNLSVFFVLFAVAQDRLGIQVSRRMANSSYVLWILSSMTSFMILSLAVDFVVTSRHGDSALVEGSIPIIFSSINKNQLAAFLLANLLTGIVNLSIDTISVTNGVAFAILTAYLGIVCITMVLFQHVRLIRNGERNRKPKEE